MGSDRSFDPEIVPGRLRLPVNWMEVFGREAPLVVEIGCGGGRFLIGLAEQDATANYLALERAGEYFKMLRERVGKRRMPNVRVCRTDAGDFIASCFAGACVTAYHLYFPDPWPKKRHHKRRLLTAEFCAHLRRTLVPGGRLYFATDHAEYLAEVLPNLRGALRVAEHPGPWEDAPAGRTNFEVKYLKEGRPVWRYVAERPVE